MLSNSGHESLAAANRASSPNRSDKDKSYDSGNDSGNNNNNNNNNNRPWTTFVLPSRDPYPLPNFTEFGQFLAASLTFTKSLRTVAVYVNDTPCLLIEKTRVQAPQLVIANSNRNESDDTNSSSNAMSKLTSWLTSSATGSGSSVNTSSPRGLFQLQRANDKTNNRGGGSACAIYESIYQITVTLHKNSHTTTTRGKKGNDSLSNDTEVATIRARHISATAAVRLPKDMVRRMHRVTKKDPPQTLTLEIYLDTTTGEEEGESNNATPAKGRFQRGGRHHKAKLSQAQIIANSFKPSVNKGRIFIGFRTSQTTGVAAHVSAPFLPTVEREAMDLQDATLRVYNMELLHMAGVVMRFTLQHAFWRLQTEWVQHEELRRSLLLQQKQNAALEAKESEELDDESEIDQDEEDDDDDQSTATSSSSSLMGFARFMARGVQKKLKSALTSVSEVGNTIVKTTTSIVEGQMSNTIDYNALVGVAPDARPLCQEEISAILLMQSFCPMPSTPDPLVGTCLAQGFGQSMPTTPAPVLTKLGVVPASQARLPAHGMEAFFPNPDEDSDSGTPAIAQSTSGVSTTTVSTTTTTTTTMSSSTNAATPAVVRHVIWQQTEEYHSVIASECKPLDLERDLLPYLKGTVLEQHVAIRLVQWWKPYSRILQNQLQNTYSVYDFDSSTYHNYNSHNSARHSASLVHNKGLALKDAISFTLLENDNEEESKNGESKAGEVGQSGSGTPKTEASKKKMVSLKDYLFYLDKDSPLAKHQHSQMQNHGGQESSLILPIPETVLPTSIQELMGETTLSDASFSNVWFQPLPMELWMEYMAFHPILHKGLAIDSAKRLVVLTLFHQEYRKRSGNARHEFGKTCRDLLANCKCMPYDLPTTRRLKLDITTGLDSTSKPNATASTISATSELANVDVPSNLYLYSAELKAFEGVDGSSFHKVAKEVQDAAVGEDFLLALGVRKSVSIDFLFENLDSLKWSDDPRPLVEYLKSATLTQEDLMKLAGSKYLPAEQPKTNHSEETKNSSDQPNYAPGELYLPSEELRIFPFLKLLLWPSETELSERSENGKFLVRLGMKAMPPLSQVLQYLSSDLTAEQRTDALDFLANHLSPSAAYHAEYSRMSLPMRKRYKFLPCRVLSPLADDKTAMVSDNSSHLMSPPTCFSDAKCAVMGFPVMAEDTKVVGERRDFYASVFHCPHEPEPGTLVSQLVALVSKAKKRQEDARRKGSSSDATDVDQQILSVFATVFNYLSQRISDFSQTLLGALRNEPFIPCMCIVVEKKSLEWFRIEQVFFRQEKTENSRDSLTEELFQVVEFSPFLAAAGVKQEATTKELFKRLLENPKGVMQTLGNDEKKYRALLRRIAADPPFAKVTDKIRNTPFLLAYTLNFTSDDTSSKVDSATYDLASSRDIYIIDNSFFGRMFKVNRAPPETDLEDFYAMIGCQYISKSVEKRFEVVGKPMQGTPLTRALQNRVSERAPLLVSPHVTTRPLVRNAHQVLDSKRLNFFQASSLLAVYSLRGTTRRSKTTCFSRRTSGGSVTINQMASGSGNSIFVVDDFDWFDVGYAIGDLILKRCQLEDAFFISSLLDAPLEQLRARGFPVDRILQPPEPVAPAPIAVPPQPVAKPARPVSQPVSQPVAKPVAKAVNQEDGKPLIWNPDGTIAEDIPPTSGVGAANAANVEDSKTKATQGRQDGGFVDILMQMFPDADPEFLKAALGPNPNLDDVRNLAETMASGQYPKKNVTEPAPTKASSAAGPSASSPQGSDDATVQSDITTDDMSTTSGKGKRRKGLRKKLSKAFGFGGSKANVNEAEKPAASSPKDVEAKVPPPAIPAPNAPAPTSNESSTPHPPTNLGMGTGMSGMMSSMGAMAGAAGSSGGGIAAPSNSTTRHETQGPVAPAEDINSHKGLEQMLENTVGSSRAVDRHGVHSHDTDLTTSIPEGSGRLDECEIIDGQHLEPFAGPSGNGKTRNGIRMFYSLREPSSELLLKNAEAVESFALVLANLCKVFGLDLASVSIFNEPGGRSIAFNLNRALYFNLRFYYALHFLPGNRFSPECYSYWYITMAHELSHNLVSGHNKEHGFYTESFATKYMPKLVELLAGLK
mmetsp:Transcript_21688/g.60192  ORF Transcript_21688/g.60192 Transcript_21688/m.60192 type:complete len:2095 (+) Transcript_21688:3009-9293(+)